jgi:hypothetical protein
MLGEEQLLVCSNESPKVGVFSGALKVAFRFGFAEEQGLKITILPIHRRLPASTLGGLPTMQWLVEKRRYLLLRSQRLRAQ